MLNQSSHRFRSALTAFALITLLSACVGDVSGTVQEQTTDGSAGDPIEGATVLFAPEDGGGVFQEVTNSAGFYEITLDTGRYTVSASHPDYTYLGGFPSLVVVAGRNTANFDMEPN